MTIFRKMLQKAKFIYLNYPNNPTGAVATREFWEKTVAFAKKYNVGVVSDFAYGALGFDGYKNPSFLETPGARTSASNFTRSQRRLTWPVGVWPLLPAIRR